MSKRNNRTAERRHVWWVIQMGRHSRWVAAGKFDPFAGAMDNPNERVTLAHFARPTPSIEGGEGGM